MDFQIFKWHCLNYRMLKMEFNCATKVPAPTETPREKRAGGMAHPNFLIKFLNCIDSAWLGGPETSHCG